MCSFIFTNYAMTCSERRERVQREKKTIHQDKYLIFKRNKYAACSETNKPLQRTDQGRQNRFHAKLVVFS